MKRLAKLLPLTLLLVLVMVTTALAAPAPKVETVNLTPATATVEVGQTLTLTAVTLKHGSEYSDAWTGAAKVATVLNADGYYISTASFSAATAGTYTVTYAVTMTAGKSPVGWIGNATAVITVVAPETTKGTPNCGVGTGKGQGADNGKDNGACAKQ